MAIGSRYRRNSRQREQPATSNQREPLGSLHNQRERRIMTVILVYHGGGLVYANYYDCNGNWCGAQRVTAGAARQLANSGALACGSRSA